MRRLWIGFALVVAALAAPASGAEVTTEDTSSPRESPRALSGHVYQPTYLLTGPFTTTSFGMATQFGRGDTTAPRYDIRGNVIGSRSYELAAYGQRIDLDLHLFSPDISLRFIANGVIFAGTGSRDLLVAGATAQVALQLGLTAGKTFGNMRLAFVGDVSTEPQYSVLIGNAILNVIDTGNFDDEGLFEKVNRVRVAPGASFAWAPNPVIGLLAEARYVWTRRVTGEEEVERTAQGLTAGGLVSFDLDPLWRFPIALQAAYRGDFPVGGDGVSEVHQASAGFYYSRRVRLALGLEAVWRHGRIRPGVTPSLEANSTTAVLWLRYYW